MARNCYDSQRNIMRGDGITHTYTHTRAGCIARADRVPIQ